MISALLLVYVTCGVLLSLGVTSFGVLGRKWKPAPPHIRVLAGVLWPVMLLCVIGIGVFRGFKTIDVDEPDDLDD